MTNKKRIKISPDILKKSYLTDRSNKVLICVSEKNINKKTKAGILLSVNTWVNYEEGTHVANHSERWGVVANICKNLNYVNGDYSTMPWDTDIEIDVGDYVWFDYYMYLNSCVLEVDGVDYVLMNYNDLYAARKGGIDGKQIMLNGYCLFEPVNKKKKSDLDITDENEKDYRYGIARFLGSPNKSYQAKSKCDDIDVKIGDTVLFSKFKQNSPLFLEYEHYANFDNGNMYLISQRHHINAIL